MAYEVVPEPGEDVAASIELKLSKKAQPFFLAVSAARTNPTGYRQSLSPVRSLATCWSDDYHRPCNDYLDDGASTAK